MCGIITCAVNSAHVVLEEFNVQYTPFPEIETI